jgi:hypothetical protein
VALAARQPIDRPALLRLATGLGAAPDYQLTPWRELQPRERTAIDAEAHRGR